MADLLLAAESTVIVYLCILDFITVDTFCSSLQSLLTAVKSIRDQCYLVLFWMTLMAAQDFNRVYMLLIFVAGTLMCWCRRGIVVTHWTRSTQLLCAGPS